MEKKLQIREINDIQGNNYKIYDIMIKQSTGLWKSVSTHFSLKEALEWNQGIMIEDTTKE